MNAKIAVPAAALVVAGAAWLLTRGGDEADSAQGAPSVAASPSAQEARKSPESQPATAAVPPCVFALGSGHTYEVALDSTYVVNPAAMVGTGTQAADTPGQTVEATTRWRITFRPVLRRPDSPTIVAFAVQDWTSTAGGEDATKLVVGVDRPFMAEIDDRCRVRNVAREKANSAQALLAVQSALDQIMVVGPEDAGVPQSYTATHQDAIGQLVARYRWSPARGDKPRRALRERDHYLKTGSDRALRVDRTIDHSRRDITWGPGAFYERFEGLERTREATGGSGVAFAVVTERSKVETIATPGDPFAGFDLRPSNFVWGRVDRLALQDKGDGRWTGRPLAEHLAEFDRLRGLGNREGMRLAQAELVA